MFLCSKGYDIIPASDETSCTIKKSGSKWTHCLSSVAFRQGRFRVVVDETARAGSAINFGVADAAANEGDPNKQNYIIWINDQGPQVPPHGHDDGFFWNGTMAGADTGGYRPGLPLSGLGALTLDVIVENRALFFRA